ncbi:unnamed protein product (macronuclear) [Paramecium tetraurelia]|uniref:Uncharacterized protein n=1 Tax=Paramecium tetraurelia TaxID=5888 RepID=A0BHN2_PARTE|nr:uncharacterized protein GSPATT00029085001 [Paramecium tetraurelia]CAK58049.1 unnamed protein product [Paramecium tetraurelia]|eukprot:XP_001425447.1 hypothetical protein (macronuclear) [Paramecium tetraurelia strain d4-2]
MDRMITLFIISNYLENYSKHLTLLRKLSVILRYLTQAFKSDELTRAWQIFFCSLIEKDKQLTSIAKYNNFLFLYFLLATKIYNAVYQKSQLKEMISSFKCNLCTQLQE